jgi:hypothetical protein
VRDLKKSTCRRVFRCNAKNNTNSQDDLCSCQANNFSRLSNRYRRESIRQSTSRSTIQTAFSHDDPKTRDSAYGHEAIA